MDRTAVVSLRDLREAVRRLGAQDGVNAQSQVRLTMPDDRDTIDIEIVPPTPIEIPTH